jgi:hypothetical protein
VVRVRVKRLERKRWSKNGRREDEEKDDRELGE